MRPVYNQAMIHKLLRALLALAFLAGCAAPPPAPPPATPTGAFALPAGSTPAALPTFTLAPPAGDVPRASPTAAPAAATATPTLLPTPTPLPLPGWYEPAGCFQPPDDLTPVEINGWTINRRTLAMLEQAQALYGGEIQLTGAALTQGSYHDNGSASFGTHLGGGAVDLSIFLPGTWTVDYPRLQRLVRALRAAGFAAWVRDIDEVYPGSGYHIHAIAVGDPQLSGAAQEQLTGRYGYFYGWNGLPKPDGVPVAGREGAPLLCGWMLSTGYSDQSAGAGLPAPFSAAEWPARLRAAAESLQTGSHDETVALARSLYYQGGQTEQPDTLDGPLAGWLWARSGLLPTGLHPAYALAAYRPSSARMDALAAGLPPEDYARLSFSRNAGENPAAYTPLPGDLVELRAAGEARMLLVAWHEDGGRAYTVTPLPQADGGWRVQAALLADPADPAAGLLAEWAARADAEVDVLRYRWSGLPDTLPLEYPVAPGDTLPALALRFNLPIDAMLAANQGLNAARLDVGQTLVIPAP